jgi:hypothetical protein
MWLSNGQVPAQLTPFAVSATAASAVFLVVSLLGRKFRKKSRKRSTYIWAGLVTAALLTLESLAFVVSWSNAPEMVYVAALMVITLVGSIHVSRKFAVHRDLSKNGTKPVMVTDIPGMNILSGYIALTLGLLLGLVLQVVVRVFVTADIWQTVAFWVANAIALFAVLVFKMIASEESKS